MYVCRIVSHHRLINQPKPVQRMNLCTLWIHCFTSSNECFFCLGVWPIKLKGTVPKIELSKKRSNAETNSVSVKLYNASGKWKTFHTSVGRKCTSPGQIYVSSHAKQNKQTEPTAAQGRSPTQTKNQHQPLSALMGDWTHQCIPQKHALQTN